MYRQKMHEIANTADSMLFRAVNEWSDAARGTFRTAAAASPAAAAVIVTAARVLATNNDPATKALDGVLDVIYSIVNIIGIILTVVGLVSFAISYYQEDAAGKNRAAMTIATGIVLLILRQIIETVDPASWLQIGPSTGGSGTGTTP